uniref:Uncharacterized protein n=1 Tax=Trichogramma kaykai TaxID=54128 RepID=A0ABD2W552_9HYME
MRLLLTVFYTRSNQTDTICFFSIVHDKNSNCIDYLALIFYIFIAATDSQIVPRDKDTKEYENNYNLTLTSNSRIVQGRMECIKHSRTSKERFDCHARGSFDLSND